MDYTTTALVTAVIVVGGTEAKRITTGEALELSPVIAGFLLGIFLFLLGLVNEDLGTKFCILIIVASLIYNGVPLFTALTAKKG